MCMNNLSQLYVDVHISYLHNAVEGVHRHQQQQHPLEKLQASILQLLHLVDHKKLHSEEAAAPHLYVYLQLLHYQNDYINRSALFGIIVTRETCLDSPLLQHELLPRLDYFGLQQYAMANDHHLQYLFLQVT